MCAYLSECYDSFHKSQSFLNALDKTYFPFDPFELVKAISQEKKIVLVTKEKYLNFKKNDDASIDEININDARCIYDPNTKVYLIVYNEKAYPYQRIRFSIAHELGHIILEHLDDENTEMDRGGISSIVYFGYEKEANTFAGNLLAPPILVNEFVKGKSFKADLIASVFGLSLPAVTDYRKSDYFKWLSIKKILPCEKQLLIKFQKYIFQRICGYCGHVSYGKNKKYCEICGRPSKVFYGDKDYLKVNRKDINMKYEKVETDAEGRVVKCSICDNEIMEPNSSYCHICGKPNINLCQQEHEDQNYPSYYSPCDESIGKHLLPNARYCPYCGSKTIFNKEGVLSKWEDALPF